MIDGNVPLEVAGELDVFVEGETSSDDESPEPPRKITKHDLPKWKKSHLPPMAKISQPTTEEISKSLVNNHPHLAEFDEIGLYYELFGCIIDLLVTETNRYGTRDKNDPSFSITKDDLCKWLGLLLMSGYNLRTSERAIGPHHLN